MIKFESESPVTCSCRKPAIRRTVLVAYGGKGGRMVSFDTHAQAMTDKGMIAALGRLDTFHRRLYEIDSDLKKLSEDERKIEVDGSIGRLISFDLETVHPDACNVRTEIVPTAVIQSFGLRKSIRLEPREQKGQSAKSILRELKEAAKPVIALLKRRRDEGDF